MNIKSTLAAFTASALLAVTLGACGDSEKLGRTINSNGYTFQEVEGYPFVQTTGAADCDEGDYIERDTDCGFPAGYAKKHKVKKAKKSKTSKSKKTRKTSSITPTIKKAAPAASKPKSKPTAKSTPKPVVKKSAPAPVVKKAAPAPVVKSAPAPVVKSAPASKPAPRSFSTKRK